MDIEVSTFPVFLRGYPRTPLTPYISTVPPLFPPWISTVPPFYPSVDIHDTKKISVLRITITTLHTLNDISDVKNGGTVDIADGKNGGAVDIADEKTGAPWIRTGLRSLRSPGGPYVSTVPRFCPSAISTAPTVLSVRDIPGAHRFIPSVISSRV